MCNEEYYANEASSMNLELQRLGQERDELLEWLTELVNQCSTLSKEAACEISQLTLAQCRLAISRANSNNR